MEDQHAVLPPEGHGSHPRVPVPGRSRRSQRRVRARSQDMVPRPMMFPRLTLHAALLVAALAAASVPALAQAPAAPAKPGPVKRGADGKPDISGVYFGDNGGANQGLEKRAA